MTRASSIAALVERAHALLRDARATPPAPDALAQAAVKLASLLQEIAQAETRPADRRRAEVLARLMDDEPGRVFTTCMTDRAYRSADPARIVDAVRGLLRALGVPAYLPALARFQLGAFARLAPFAAPLAARGVFARVQAETAHVVFSAEDPALANHLARRAAEGVHVNLNLLGEAVLGEPEAARRVERYLALLTRPDVEHVSVKVSAITSQLDPFAFDATLARLLPRLRTIYTAALKHPLPDGRPRLVTLDMEAHHDIEVTLAAFRTALDEPDLLGLTAGVALQAYLPETPELQRELTTWAQARVARGGAPIRLRIVKGANLLAEQALASLRGWEVPIHPSKAQVDASFKRVLDFGCQPEHARAANLGIGSHNVFDVAYALLVRATHGVEDQVAFELLEGMADPLRRAVQHVAGNVLLYTPIVGRDAMHTAVAYLMRRFDESTAEQNFLRHAFAMRLGDAAWDAQRERFVSACAARDAVDETLRKRQDRRQPPQQVESAFANAPDTDFSLPHHRAWIAETLARWAPRRDIDVALDIAGQRVWRAPFAEGFDPSRPGLVPYRHPLANEDDLERALACAQQAVKGWSGTPAEERARILHELAHTLERERGELIAAMVLDAGKRVEEADVEISEVIDFARYYAETFLQALAEGDVGLRALGPVLVAPPWNFPLAIPGGGVMAALMAGNPVILKPALESVLVAERFAQAAWKAGVPRRVLQLVVCEDELASRLVRDRRTAAVILTGATDTARKLLAMRPGLRLFAETGGKNAMIVSELSDRDQAIADTVASAFGHAGQKCSAASLLVLESGLYDDARFLETLRDAAASLPVGSAWEPASFVTPLIREASGPLARGLTSLDDGETWLLEPQRAPNNPRLWSPGIKLGVRPGSFTHQTELFGPVLAVMRAADLEHAFELANATPYGLTSGLHSLDEREQARWASRIHAGNLYINRRITGAIVRRQPFGGMKASSFGPGAKAGGPGYAAQLTTAVERELPHVSYPPTAATAALSAKVRRHLKETERERLGRGACSYADAYARIYGVDHDPSGVIGERNVLRYLPCDPMLVRVAPDASDADVLLTCAAMLTLDVACELSVPAAFAQERPWLRTLPGVRVRTEDAASCASRVAKAERVRAIGTPEAPVIDAARTAGVHVATEPVLLNGRFELRHYVHEQALSHRYHRYGNLAPAALLPPLRRAPPEAAK